MKEDFVSCEQSRALKDVGLDVLDCNHAYYIHSWMNEPKFALYDEALFEESQYDGTEVYPAPTQALAAKWLREVKDTIVIAEPYWECEIEDDSDYLTCKWCFVVWIDGCSILCNFDPSKEDEELWLFDSYESALSAGIANALNLLTDKQ